MRCSSRTPLCLIELWDDAAGFRAHRRRRHRHDTHRRRRRSIFGINLSLFLSLESVVRDVSGFGRYQNFVVCSCFFGNPFFFYGKRKKQKEGRKDTCHHASCKKSFFSPDVSQKKLSFFWLFFCEIFVLLFFVFRQNACAHFFKMRVFVSTKILSLLLLLRL